MDSKKKGQVTEKNKTYLRPKYFFRYGIEYSYQQSNKN